MSKRTYSNSTISLFPDGFEMVLPDGYRIDTDYDDDCNEIYHLRGGFYTNDDGEEDFSFSGSFIGLDVNLTLREGADPRAKENIHNLAHPDYAFNQVAEGVMQSLKNQYGPGKIIKLYKSHPAATIMKFNTPLSLLGVTFYTESLFCWFEVSENTVFGFNSVCRNNPSEAGDFYKHLLNVIKSVRVNGKPVDTGKLTPKKLEKALDLDSNIDINTLDLGLGIDENINGDKTKTGKVSLASNTSDAEISYTTPDESLYPHYKHKMEIEGMTIPGAVVVVNKSGTDYQFCNLEEGINEDTSGELRDAISQIYDIDQNKVDLEEKVTRMSALFHVSPDVFDSTDDRECEIAEGLMKKAYMMSALRSFAWTVKQYCIKKGLGTAEIGRNKVYEILNNIAEAGWLNYDDKSVCKGLCSNQDLHVYYLPDETPEDVKALFLPSAEIVEQTRKIQEKIPTYNPILSQVGSLDKLREDLEEIGEAVEFIYDELKKKRDYNEPLIGNDADILYAWCALAYASRDPFYIEDGPSTCNFTQLNTDIAQDENKESSVVGNDNGTGEYDDGKYIVSGTTLIGYRDDSEVMNIPEGVTDICVDFNDPNWLCLSDINAKKMIYPKSYNGIIVMPANVEEIEVLGDYDCPELISDGDLGNEEIALKKLSFKGKIRTFSDPNGELYYAKNLYELTLPEGLKTIEDWYLCQSNIRKLYIPKTLETISNCDLEGSSSGVMDEYGYPTTEIVVHRTCPAISELKSAYEEMRTDIDDHNEIASSYPNITPYKTIPFTLTIID